MKIKFSDIKNELLRHCVIHCLSKMNEPLSKEFIADVHKNDGEMKLKLFADIDGSIVELALESWFGRLEEHYNETLIEKAEEIVKLKFYDLEKKFDEIIEGVREKLDDDIRNYINKSLNIVRILQS